MYRRRDLLKAGIFVLGFNILKFPKLSDDFTISDTKQVYTPFKQSICRWTMNDYTIEELCEIAVMCGLDGIDLVGPVDWPILKRYNLNSSMCNGAEIGLTKGWNDEQYHKILIKNYKEHIDLVSQNGYKNIICFSGNKNGMPYEKGLENCVKGLSQILKQAEKKGVVLHMELFNSKMDHPDYMCDSTKWGIELCKSLDSESFKLLFDIYHMQIQEGDIIKTIQDNYKYFGHYHAAGVPGRHELDFKQELNYSAISSAIAETGFDGYLAHEYLPTQTTKLKRIKDLQKAIKICRN